MMGRFMRVFRRGKSDYKQKIVFEEQPYFNPHPPRKERPNIAYNEIISPEYRDIVQAKWETARFEIRLSSS